MVTRLAEQMRYIDLRHRIGADDNEHVARHRSHQRLAGAQRWQRAFQTAEVEDLLPLSSPPWYGRGVGFL